MFRNGCITRQSDKSEYLKTKTGKGEYWEKWFCDNYGAKWMNQDCSNQKWDIEWNGMKIDVKMSSGYKRNRKRGKEVVRDNQVTTYAFNRNNYKKEVTHLLFILVENNIAVEMYLVPNPESQKGFCITKGSKKYEKFKLDL